MPIEALSIGPATTILQNITYALPSRTVFLTSIAAIETSLNGTDWLPQPDSVTGVLIGSVFVRCTTADTIVVCSNAIISTGEFDQDLNTDNGVTFASLTLTDIAAPPAETYMLVIDDSGVLSSQAIGGGNPFDQDLNTTDSPQFAGEGIGTAGVPEAITFADNAYAINWPTVQLSVIGAGDLAITGGGLVIPDDKQVRWLNGPAMTADGFSLVINGTVQIGGDGTVTAVESLSVLDFVAASSYRVGATPGIDTTITTGSLVGKTITITKGIITGFA